jgi:resolvase-like protein
LWTTCDNQLLELRRNIEARGCTGQEFADSGITGSKDQRPALDALLRGAKQRKFDVLVNLLLPNRAGVRFYNKRGTAEQWIKEGKQAAHWTRLSCHRFRANEASGCN